MLWKTKTYLERYGSYQHTGLNLSSEEAAREFNDWTLKLDFGDDGVVEILCCPEDRKCQQCNVEEGFVCGACEVPLCHECDHAISKHNNFEPSAKALSNDMMIFYAPADIYTDQWTVMEMICCSPCLTSLICCSMEVRYGNMFDPEMHMQRHRVGARGNATTFLSPWEDMLRDFQRSEEETHQRKRPQLPRLGTELAEVVQVLLKANDLIHNTP